MTANYRSWRPRLVERACSRKQQACLRGQGGARTTAELTKFVAQLRSKKKSVNGKQTAELLSAWTLHNVAKVLRLIFKFAYRNGYIGTNPLDRIRDELPTGRNKTSAWVLDAEDVNRLIEATSEHYRMLITLLAFTGMRISEALGLAWADVYFDAGAVNVRRQLSRAKRGEPARRVCSRPMRLIGRSTSHRRSGRRSACTRPLLFNVATQSPKTSSSRR